MNDLTQKAFGLSGRCSMRAYNEVSGGVFVAQSGEASSRSQAGEWSMKTRSSSSSSECEGQKEQPYSKLCHSSVLISSPRHRLALCIGDFTLWNKQGIAIKHHHSQMTQNYGSRVEANLWFKGLWYFMVLERFVSASYCHCLCIVQQLPYNGQTVPGIWDIEAVRASALSGAPSWHYEVIKYAILLNDKNLGRWVENIWAKQRINEKYLREG